MQTIIYFKRAFILIALLFLSSFVFGQGHPREKKSHFNIGLNYSRISIIPYLSLDCMMKEKIGITVEFKPRFLVPNYLGLDLLEPYMKSEYDTPITYNGFFTNFIVHTQKPEDGKWHFTQGLELSYYQHFREKYAINIYGSENPCGGPSLTDYIEFSIKSRVALTALFYYGKSKFKLFAGLGIGRIQMYSRGYHSYSYPTTRNIIPFNDVDISFLPVIKLGFRFGINIF